jgi:hypothetical protein
LVGGIDCTKYVNKSFVARGPHFAVKSGPVTAGASPDPRKSAEWHPAQVCAYAACPACAWAAV